jgi:uncharacterized protein YcaQ
LDLKPFLDLTITIKKHEARQFILAHHGLRTPRSLTGKEGILKFIQRVGSIQFDPINIVGRNPDLVLQSRVMDYRSSMLDDLLYSDRKLLDGWDKMASIYPIEDWPNFSRRRAMMSQQGFDSRRPSEEVLKNTLAEIQEKGALSSLNFSNDVIVDWHWGPTKIARAALESLFTMGKIGVHHRINNRRYFDLIQNLIHSKILTQPDPFKTIEEYRDWHILRRIGGMGLVNSKSGESWLGIMDTKSPERISTLYRLIENGKIIPILIDECPKDLFFIRSSDNSTLLTISRKPSISTRASIIAPLDNLIWNRSLINQIFNFKYIWEVYKPKSQRKYGYYVLPVLYQDRFIARFEPLFNKKTRELTINNWWWETDIKPDELMHEALSQCFLDFQNYLDASSIHYGKNLQNIDSLPWLLELFNR